MDRRTALLTLGGGLTSAMFANAAGAASEADNFPSRPVRFVVPFPSGGASDLMARTVAEALTAKWGKSVFVDNKPAGNGIVGSKFAADQPADGYTWLEATFFHVTNPGLYSNLPYDTLKDFTALATISKTRNILVVRAGLPANNVKELVAYAKANPNKVTYGSAGVGGGVHLAGALFAKTSETQLVHVPYKGAAQLMTDIMGGVVDLAFQTSQVALPALDSGKVKAFAVSGDSRLPALPNVPTFAEAGLNVNVQGWFGIVAPAGVPQPIIDKINADVASVLGSAQVREGLEKVAAEPFITSAPDTNALIKSDIERYTRLIKEENIKVE